MAMQAPDDPNCAVEDSDPHMFAERPSHHCPLHDHDHAWFGTMQVMQPQPSFPSVVYAVRQGRDNLQGIFFQWDHCALVIEGCQDSEYETFGNLNDAVLYVLNCKGNSARASPQTKQKKTQPPQPVTDKLKTATKSPEKRAPKYWMQLYEEYRQFKDNPPTQAMAKKVQKFATEQRTEYRYRMQGKETKMIDDKLEKLETIGFDFQYQELLQEDMSKWDNMLQEFKAYRKAADTTCQLKQSTALRDWMHSQRVQFQNLQEGKRSTLTPERIQKLNDAGFVFCPRSSFRTMTWEERITQLQDYKQQHGHLNVPTNHPELGYFTSNVRRAYKYLRDGKKTGFTEEKVAQLTDMGFNFLVGKRKSGPIELKSWDEQFQLLVDFKKQFGHTVVPQHYPGLGRFVKQMRREFKLMKEGKRSTMTPEKVLKLADIGFVFDAQFRRGSKISTNNFTKVGGKKRGDQGG